MSDGSGWPRIRPRIKLRISAQTNSWKGEGCIEQHHHFTLVWLSINSQLLRKSRTYHWDLNPGSRERNPHSLCPSLNICSLEFGLGQVEEGGSKRGTAEAQPKCVHFPQSLAPPMHLCVGRNLFGVNRLDATDCGS